MISVLSFTNILTAYISQFPITMFFLITYCTFHSYFIKTNVTVMLITRRHHLQPKYKIFVLIGIRFL